jgi:hypothetical protein
MTGIKKFQWTVLVVILLGFLFLFSPPAYAGAGANVNACIYLPTKPVNQLQFNISAGGSGTHCMNHDGNDPQITVNSPGLTCGSVGYVEGKSSSTGGDTCATDTSYWVLGYSASGTPYSGSTNSTWSHPIFGDNHIELVDYTKGTSVCTTSNLCSATKQQWDSGTQGPLYIIFQPAAAQ